MNVLVKAIEMLELDLQTSATAILYTYRYQQFQTKEEIKVPFNLISAAAIFLACKQTGSKRKLRDIVNVFYYIVSNQLLEIDDLFWKLRDSVVYAEYLLLRVLGFDLLPDDLIREFVYTIERKRIERTKVQMMHYYLTKLIVLQDISELRLKKDYNTIIDTCLYLVHEREQNDKILKLVSQIQ
ncbi:hypothetical protein HDV04_005125 [Boothiomyces sp. JEL0838]|nr:hypothetical protein HDV04_005125 [Boothiomyces sp. JEL0838]